MSTYFNRKPVPLATQAEIERRAKDSKWIDGRQTYVYITSMCDKCNPGYQLSLQASIKSQAANYKAVPAGKAQGGKGIDPPPPPAGNSAHVTELKVQKQGELGTSRKATVQIRCESLEELIELQKCYFIPGMSVRIQWGWKGYVGPKYNQLVLDSKPERLLDATAIKSMTDHTAAHPNNEGMQGPVANFGYTYNESIRQWDCFIEVISATSGLTMEPSCKPNPVFANFQPGDDGKNKLISLDRMETLLGAEAAKGVNMGIGGVITAGVIGAAATVGVAALTVATFGVGTAILATAAAAAAAVGAGAVATSFVSADTGRKVEEHWTSVFQYEGETRDPLNFGKADGGFFSSTMGTGTNEAYISLGKLTDIINNVADDSGKSNACNFTDQKLIAPEYLGCSDARICFIPGTRHLEDLLDDYKDNQVPHAFKVVKGNKGEVIVNLIAVNAIHALQVYHEMKEAAGADPKTNKKTVVIAEYLNRILNDINVSCGNPWKDLGVEFDDKKRTLVVVEEKLVGSGDITPPPFSLPIGAGAYVISELKLELKMTSAMKTQAVYGSNDSLGSGDKCTQPKFQAFGLSTGLFENLGKPERVEIKPCKQTPEEKAYVEEMEAEIPTTQKLFEEAGDGHSDSDCTNLADRLSDIYNFKVDWVTGIPPKSVSKAALAAACKNIPLPFEMSFQMDGIGGFGFGQVVTSNIIPPDVRKNFEFQVLNVDHTIDKSGWKIGVTTVARTNPTSQSNG